MLKKLIKHLNWVSEEWAYTVRIENRNSYEYRLTLGQWWWIFTSLLMGNHINEDGGSHG